MIHCNEAQERISALIDLELVQSEEVSLRKHLEECRGCSNLYQELASLRRSVGGLELPEPPERIWLSLKSQLLIEGLIRPLPQPGFWQKLFPFGLSIGLRPAFAGALATLFLVGISYFLMTGPIRKGEQRVISSDALVLGEVQKAELHYLKAIEALSEVSQKKLETLDPKLAQIFNDNLATMDYYLKECKEAVQANPDNPLVHRYLMAAYQKKVELMQTIVNSDSL